MCTGDFQIFHVDQLLLDALSVFIDCTAMIPFFLNCLLLSGNTDIDLFLSVFLKVWTQVNTMTVCVCLFESNVYLGLNNVCWNVQTKS